MQFDRRLSIYRFELDNRNELRRHMAYPVSLFTQQYSFLSRLHTAQKSRKKTRTYYVDFDFRSRFDASILYVQIILTDCLVVGSVWFHRFIMCLQLVYAIAYRVTWN